MVNIQTMKPCILQELNPIILGRNVERMKAIPAIAEYWCTVDMPWLLNSTIDSYPCYCRVLVHSICAVAIELDYSQLSLLLQSTGAQ